MSHSKTHLFPAIISVFLPGVGQILKGHIMKGIGVIIAGVAIAFFLSWTIIIPILYYIWNIHDAYTA